MPAREGNGNLLQSTFAWKIPWTEEPGRLQSMGWQTVEHDWATSLSLFSFMHWRRKWQPTPVFLPGESRDGGAWWAAISGLAQGWTRLKWLSSGSSSIHASILSRWEALKGHFVRSFRNLPPVTFTGLVFYTYPQSNNNGNNLLSDYYAPGSV